LQSEVKKKTLAYGGAAILLALVLSVALYNFAVVPETPTPGPGPGPGPEPEPPETEKTLQRFTSYGELLNFIKASLTTQPRQAYFNSPWRVAWAEALANSAAVTYVDQAVKDYSRTNIQVAGVDEADIVKTDGAYLYAVSNNTLYILKAYPPQDAETLSRISFNGDLGEILLYGDKLAVIGGSARYPYYAYVGPAVIVDDKTRVEVYDVSDRRVPTLTRNFTVSGNYFSSRMIDEYVYLIVSQPAYLLYDTLVLPKVYSGSDMTELGPSEISYSNITDYYYAFTTVAAINIQDDEQEPTHETFLLGATSNMYVSVNNIYITFWAISGGTLIHRIHIDDQTIRGEAKGEVPGTVLNQFSMDEYNDHLRIATTNTALGTSQNNLYVMNMSLDVVGKIENMAPGESIYSVRFMGDRGYVVTFRQVDPFFAIDLTDPSNPKVLGVLKIPGYSSYLHPYDETHIIGIGKNGSNVKMSLFDVTDVTNPQEIDNFQVSAEWSDSLVFSDHKAFLFNKTKSLLVLPISKSGYDVTKGYVYWQGVYVFRVTTDGFVLKGQVTHAEGEGPQPFYYGYSDSYEIKRSLYIEDVLYTVSGEKVMMHDLKTLAELNQVEFD